MLILIFGTKSCFGDDFGQYDTDHYFTPSFGQTPLRNSFVMATPKVSGEQKLFERVCHVKTKSDKGSVCYTLRFLSFIEKTSASKIGLKIQEINHTFLELI